MAFIVVSDTSPIRALDHLGLTHVLEALFDEVVIPPAVVDELENPRPGFTPIHVTSIPGVRVQAPADAARVTQIMSQLDPGESEAIALAEEFAAVELLIDEMKGRLFAISVGIRTVGALGVLLRAKKARIIGDVKPLMDRLIGELRFYVDTRLYADVLRLAGE